MWVAQGRLGEALDWARERGLSVDDDLSYLREFEHITLARVLLARRERPRHRSARGGGTPRAPPGTRRTTAERAGSVIEILVLQALAHQRAATSPPRSCRWSAP